MSNSIYKAIALMAASTISIIAANANPLSFAPNGDNNCGSMKCEVPLTSLGGMVLKAGSANIAGKVITIKAGSAYIDTPRTVLIGSVLRTEANITSEPPSVTGLALFLMGDWQSQIDDGVSKDVIFRKDGHLDGRILGVENDSLSVNVNGIPQKVPINSILYIRSPRVFVFKIALRSRQGLQKDTAFQAETADASFRPTGSPRTLSGSVIPQSDKREDGMGMSSGNSLLERVGAGAVQGLSGNNVMPTAGGMGMQGMNTFNRPGTAVPNPKDDSFDDGDEANKFSTVKTRFGSEKLSLPPGILE